MQQNEGGSYLEMEEIQKGERETRRKADKAGWQGVFLKQCSPFCLSLLWKVPWSLPPMGTPTIKIPKHLYSPAFGFPLLVGQRKDRQNAWTGGGDACQRGL